MKIKPNASPAEITSPFFTLNEAFCSDFENYIASKNGKVKGNYNAWSYLIFGKITQPKNWNLMYKKATFSSAGNLLLSSESQSLLVMAEWETEHKVPEESEFVIRKKTKVDVLNILIRKSISKLEVSDEYVIHSKGRKPNIYLTLIEILKPLFISEEIYKVENINNKLRIELRSKKHHFEIIDKLIEL